MVKKLGAALAGLALVVFGLASPANASTINGCPNDDVCLYQWTGYGAPSGDANPGWKSSMYNLALHTNGCINLTSPMAYWPNGDGVSDNSGSIYVNGQGDYFPYDIGFYDWINCNDDGNYFSETADIAHGESNLNGFRWGNGDTSPFHRITSIRLFHVACPPGGC
jgi:hypothetical protein